MKINVIFGEHDEKTVQQMQTVLDASGEDGQAVLSADAHVGMGFPVGGIFAHPTLLCLQGAGVDLFCGNMAVKLDSNHLNIHTNINKIMDEVVDKISFGMGKKNNYPNSHELFDHEDWDKEPMKGFKSIAQQQLGTIGGGNHYVDIFVDEENSVWVGVHFGSRGFGHKIARHFMNLTGMVDGIDSYPVFLKHNSYLGQEYLRCLEMAGKYAYASREWVCHYIAKHILGGNVVESVHNHHNANWREIHNGQELFVVRKGATPAFPGQKGFVGGSMGDNSYILEGVDSELSKTALYSTVHGAGRVMSRTQAKGKYVKNEEGKKIRQAGLVRHDDMKKWIADKGVCLRGGDVDELGYLFRVHWELKKKRANGMSSEFINECYDTALKHGALGGKLIGAGGGGFFMFYCINSNKLRLAESMRKMGLKQERFRFDFEGAKILVNA